MTILTFIKLDFNICTEYIMLHLYMHSQVIHCYHLQRWKTHIPPFTVAHTSTQIRSDRTDTAPQLVIVCYSHCAELFIHPSWLPDSITDALSTLSWYKWNHGCFLMRQNNTLFSLHPFSSDTKVSARLFADFLHSFIPPAAWGVCLWVC